MLKNRGLAFKLTGLILLSITLIFSLVFLYNTSVSREMIKGQVEKGADNLALSTVYQIDSVLNSVEKVPETLARLMETTACSDKDLIHMLRSVVTENPEIYGAAIAFEPYAHKENVRHFAPYMCKDQDDIRFTTISYDYWTWDWYQIPKELGHAIWSEPYFDEGAGNIVMSTYSVPFYKSREGERKLAGIITADISLVWLQQLVSRIKIAQTGYGFLMSRNGTFVTHPNRNLVMNESIFSWAEGLGDENMRELGRAMIQGQKGFVPIRLPQIGEAWLAYAPLPSNGWALGVVFPQTELMADIDRLNRNVLFISLAGFGFICLLIVLIAQSITRPVRSLSAAAAQIAEGNLDGALPAVKSRDEVGKLAESFLNMQESLKRYILELTETTAAKERIESELKIAHDIQMGLLPKIFPPFPDRKEFDIFADMEPAKEVGGDFYDFFFLDKDHLCLAIGDVSGKGVPAALFMAITKTLIKTKATQGLSAAVVLTRVNEDLSLDNPSMMFVTLFLGILDLRTGELEYSNGGHNPPYLLSRTKGVSPLAPTGDMALGVMEEYAYSSKSVKLEPGESLFLYTDGVTEAMNEKDELFSDERLAADLEPIREATAVDLVSGILQNVKMHAAGVAQSDDITVMALTYFKGENSP